MKTLIKNGTLYTMSPLGTMQGDVLLANGRIEQVALHIDACEAEMDHIIDAAGMHVCPGLIDAHVHFIRAADRIETDIRSVTKDALYAGVTTIALWQDSGKESILSGGWGNDASSKLIHVQAEGMRADPLRRVMEWAERQGSTLGCEICSTGKLKQVLQLREEIGCRIILVHLSDCLGMEDEIVVSGCQVITGACCLRGKNNAYEMAVRLQNRGVTVAITADYPASRLHYLPLTAGLCRRAGMTLEDALSTVTLNAAKILGIEAQCGSIEPGKRADLVIYDGEPLKFATGKIAVFSSGEMV